MARGSCERGEPKAGSGDSGRAWARSGQPHQLEAWRDQRVQVWGAGKHLCVLLMRVCRHKAAGRHSQAGCSDGADAFTGSEPVSPAAHPCLHPSPTTASHCCWLSAQITVEVIFLFTFFSSFFSKVNCARVFSVNFGGPSAPALSWCVVPQPKSDTEQFNRSEERFF